MVTTVSDELGYPTGIWLDLRESGTQSETDFFKCGSSLPQFPSLSCSGVLFTFSGLIKRCQISIFRRSVTDGLLEKLFISQLLSGLFLLEAVFGHLKFLFLITLATLRWISVADKSFAANWWAPNPKRLVSRCTSIASLGVIPCFLFWSNLRACDKNDFTVRTRVKSQLGGKASSHNAI